jgi:hypothetical protein
VAKISSLAFFILSYVFRDSLIPCAVAFRAYDADRSGYIDKDELRAMMLAGLSAQGCGILRSTFCRW